MSLMQRAAANQAVTARASVAVIMDFSGEWGEAKAEESNDVFIDAGLRAHLFDFIEEPRLGVWFTAVWIVVTFTGRRHGSRPSFV